MARKEDQTLLWIALAGGIAYLLLRKRRKGSVEIGPLDEGEFLPDNYKDLETDSTNTGNGDIVTVNPGGNAQAFVGPLPVTYGSLSGNTARAMVNGIRRKGRMVGKTIIIG